MVNEVAAGRPDEKDAVEIADFAEKVLEKLNSDNCDLPKVPGNIPYREGMTVTAAPMCTDLCGKCGACAEICPADAITVTETAVETQLEKCILCVGCIAHCPSKARILPPPMQEGMNQKLGALKDIRRECEFYL